MHGWLHPFRKAISFILNSDRAWGRSGWKLCGCCTASKVCDSADYFIRAFTEDWLKKKKSFTVAVWIKWLVRDCNHCHQSSEIYQFTFLNLIPVSLTQSMMCQVLLSICSKSVSLAELSSVNLIECLLS